VRQEFDEIKALLTNKQITTSKLNFTAAKDIKDMVITKITLLEFEPQPSAP
jgi:hypothetical protein